MAMNDALDRANTFNTKVINELTENLREPFNELGHSDDVLDRLKERWV